MGDAMASLERHISSRTEQRGVSFDTGKLQLLVHVYVAVVNRLIFHGQRLYLPFKAFTKNYIPSSLILNAITQMYSSYCQDVIYGIFMDLGWLKTQDLMLHFALLYHKRYSYSHEPCYSESNFSFDVLRKSRILNTATPAKIR